MTEQLMEIGGRLAGLRDIMDISVESMAKAMQLDTEEYLAYEHGERDFEYSFIHNAAGILDVDIVDIISGDSPKLTTCTLVRKGEGYPIKRSELHDYRHLAFTFNNRKSDPVLVTVSPDGGSPFTWYKHKGQELNYMVSGRMEFSHSGTVYELNEGDSVYFDSGVDHAMKALGDRPAQFLAVVIK